MAALGAQDGQANRRAYQSDLPHEGRSRSPQLIPARFLYPETFSSEPQSHPKKGTTEVSDDYNNQFDNLFEAELPLSRSDVRQEVGKALADIAQYSAQQTAGVQHALEEVASEIPDFTHRMPQMRRVVAEEKVLADAITQAEGNPALQTYLPGLYKIAYKLSKSQEASGSEPAQSERPESSRPTGLTEENIFAGTEASKRVNLSPINRKSLIASLEEKGILDVEF